MKKIIFFLISFGMFGCDKIELPFKHGSSENNTPVNVPAGPTAVEKVRKILIEDYTGHKCHNCPPAAARLEEIQAANPGRVIGIAIHAGYQSNPVSPNYTTNFQTTAGNDWFTFFGFIGTPSGMVNRKGYPVNHVYTADSWAAETATLLSIPPDAYIGIAATYDAGTRTVNTTITNEFLTAQNGTFKLCAVLTESGITDYQLLEDMSNSPNYVFNHVLRVPLNSTWGDPLATGSIEPGNKQSKNYSITLATQWNAVNCKIVAFVYNADTYEVVQAEEQKLIP